MSEPASGPTMGALPEAAEAVSGASAPVGTAGPVLGPVLGLVLAGALVAASFWVFALARRRDNAHEPRLVRLGPLRHAAGTPTLLVVAVSLALGAYHAAAFSLRALGQDALPTPLVVGQWWVLAVGAVVLVILSAAADRIEQREHLPHGESGTARSDAEESASGADRHDSATRW